MAPVYTAINNISDFLALKSVLMFKNQCLQTQNSKKQ